MNMAASNVVDHRQRVLHALGVMPYVLRTRHRAAGDMRAEATPATAAAGPHACVLVLPGDCTENQLRLLENAMRALGDAFAQAPRVVVTADDLRGPVPAASAYLAFGEAQAHALGRSLPAATMAAAEVLLLDEPQALPEPGGKRRLWQAIRGLRRHWRQTAGTE